jgi:large repetitive protein
MNPTARACLGLITLSSFFAFAACSDDDDDGGGPNVAGAPSEAGAPVQGGSGGSGSHAEGGAHEGGAAHGEGSLECEVLGELCHAADTGSGPAHDCHDVGHVGHADDCTSQFASCVGVCTETDVGAGGAGGAGSGADPKCTALGSLCHEAGEIDDDAQQCHQLGHEGNAAACADGFEACATLCLAVLKQVEAGAGGAGGAGGAAAGGAAAGGAGGAR